MIGKELSNYRITAAIGAGGMGEVYRATDTKLGRDVALKVLPAEMARDPERLARFQREARADCWAMLSMMYREEYTHGFNLRPDPIGRALTAARRAVEPAPSNHLAYHALASALFFRRDLGAFRSAAERAVALNPMDGFTLAYLGFLIAYSGDWDRGCALVEQARQLNPHH